MGRSRHGIIGPDDPTISYFSGIYSIFHRFIKEHVDSLQPDKHNRYVYCYNNPVNLIDPLGLQAEEDQTTEVRVEAEEEKEGKKHAEFADQSSSESLSDPKPRPVPEPKQTPDPRETTEKVDNTNQKSFIEQAYDWVIDQFKSKSEGRVWIGYAEDQLKTLKNDFQNIHKDYTSTRNVDFVERPTYDQFKKATQRDYVFVGLHTHGDSRGLEFYNKDYHRLSELSSIRGDINAQNLGISSCSPQVQRADWNSLNTRSTTYHDLSARIGNTSGSDRSEAIVKFYNKAREYMQ